MPEIEGAIVEVIQYEEIVESGTTDANGEIEFTLPIGTYFVRVSKNGYITHTYFMECLVAKECRGRQDFLIRELSVRVISIA